MPPGTRTRTNKHVRGVLSMTTDEIAAAVQAGQAARLDLWEAVRRFAYRKAHRWSQAIGGRSGVELEDLMQVAFLALVEALGTWRPEDGALSSPGTVCGSNRRSQRPQGSVHSGTGWTLWTWLFHWMPL